MSTPSGITPREFVAGDDEGWVALANRCYPEYPGSVDELQHSDEGWDHARFFRRRLLVEREGRVVAAGEVHHSKWTFQPDKYEITVHTDPDLRGRGLGSAVYDALVAAARARQARELITKVKESLSDGLRFAQTRGFREVRREWESRLDVTSFDPAPFASAPARVAEQGIRVVSFSDELARDPDCGRAVYDLMVEANRDSPATDPITPVPFEEWRRDVLESPGALPEAFFLAVSPDGRYLGESDLYRSVSDPSFIWQGFTGVRREARGRGIAMALKLRTVEYARAHGIDHIKTWNEQGNRPMLRINEAMGFVKQPAWIELRKSLS